MYQNQNKKSIKSPFKFIIKKKGDFYMENKIYNEVPNMITTKDLDYLSDMFQWNYGALKKTSASLHNTEEEEIKEILQKGFNLFQDNLTEIITILKEGGSNE